ncbi:conserved protein of unknown function [Methanocaldococcus lauensis]|uniref:DUF86 domain-containing protein n=1 Tax=Methanocaldococcus lauensis TaxID=2546128 RepID=A0A8D6PQM4_9EURY|nr:DUF86 domain-containing protein [Methanocaldococcus lauensis]CAB3288023.1 conserved protein of unknown function [Methanocaldococcus lauensis]
MSKRGDKEILMDILEAIQRIKNYTDGMDYETFLLDTKTQDAVIRNIEIIGEAVKLLSPQIKEKYKNIPWKNIAGMRDKLIHFYFGVNIDIVWDVAKNKILELEELINEILNEISKK